MPAAVGDYSGLKIMTLARGIGNRYLLLLYSQVNGELLAILDADEVTRMRTAATTALAGSLLSPSGVSDLSIIGTGFEATGHLRAFAHMWPLSSVRVYSRSADRRVDFAERMSAELGIDVSPAVDVRSAVSGSKVTLLCTKSTIPVVSGEDFAPGAVVLSIGSTRPDLRELDLTTLRRSSVVLADDVQQVMTESGDIAEGLSTGALTADRIVSMAEWTGRRDDSDTTDRDLLTFKSVGTAMQDLLLAAELVSSAQAAGVGKDLGELASLKQSAPSAV
jgi:ornithine cyclodeaminase/alanine dehydrogenase